MHDVAGLFDLWVRMSVCYHLSYIYIDHMFEKRHIKSKYTHEWSYVIETVEVKLKDIPIDLGEGKTALPFIAQY